MSRPVATLLWEHCGRVAGGVGAIEVDSLRGNCVPKVVMAGLVPAIHVLAASKKDVDARHKAGHDEHLANKPLK
jgi:hypothetical protein